MVRKRILTDNNFLISQNTFADLKGQKENIICTIDDVRGDFLGPSHGTTPAAVIKFASDSGVHAYDGARGQGLEHLFIYQLKNDILFSI